ncbi:MAG: hypothetical protein HN431_16000 [Bacteroidetes bacterium]|jgi:hypothetical protein|nr:hypothetical protein [Bacteroidota bacterium]
MNAPSLGYTDNYSKRNLWEEIAGFYKGEFNIKFNSGHELEIHNTIIPYKKWKLYISVSDTRPLKIRIPFISNQDFELIVSWEDFIEKIIKYFRNRDMKTGWSEFDNRYLIKSSNNALSRKILNIDVQKAILKHNIYSLAYQTNKKTSKSELLCVISRRVGDLESIKEIIDLHLLLIDIFEDGRIIK